MTDSAASRRPRETPEQSGLCPPAAHSAGGLQLAVDRRTAEAAEESAEVPKRSGLAWTTRAATSRLRHDLSADAAPPARQPPPSQPRHSRPGRTTLAMRILIKLIWRRGPPYRGNETRSGRRVSVFVREGRPCARARGQGPDSSGRTITPGGVQAGVRHHQGTLPLDGPPAQGSLRHGQQTDVDGAPHPGTDPTALRGSNRCVPLTSCGT